MFYLCVICPDYYCGGEKWAYDICFLTYEKEFVLFLAALENSVLPLGWDSSYDTLKVKSVVYTHRNEKLRMMFAVILR